MEFRESAQREPGVPHKSAGLAVPVPWMLGEMDIIIKLLVVNPGF